MKRSFCKTEMHQNCNTVTHCCHFLSTEKECFTLSFFGWLAFQTGFPVSIHWKSWLIPKTKAAIFKTKNNKLLWEEKWTADVFTLLHNMENEQCDLKYSKLLKVISFLDHMAVFQALRPIYISIFFQNDDSPVQCHQRFYLADSPLCNNITLHSYINLKTCI